MKHTLNKLEKKQFTALLISGILNFIVFVSEFISGWIIHSVILLSDSSDSFIDAISYSMAIWAIFKISKTKQTTAKIIAVVQLSCALFILLQVIFSLFSLAWFSSTTPDYFIMLIFTCFSLTVNITTVLLLMKSQGKNISIKAVFIFSSIDVIANLYAIIASLISIYWWKNNELLDSIGGILFF
ncbi:MAG: cation transporter, partial [Mycoplasmataceae bacterium]|nr:cation transporter [Mycoplasmataceae bacterium]